MKDKSYIVVHNLRSFQAELPEIIRRLDQEISWAEIAAESAPPGKVLYSLPAYEMPSLREVLNGNQKLNAPPEVGEGMPKSLPPEFLVKAGIASPDAALEQVSKRESDLATQYRVYEMELRAYKKACEDLAAYYTENPSLEGTPAVFGEFLNQACDISYHHIPRLKTLQVFVNEGTKNLASDRHRNSAKQLMESALAREQIIISMRQKIIDHCQATETVLREQMIHEFLNRPLPPAEERLKSGRNLALGSTFAAVGIAGVTYKTSYKALDAIPGSILTVFALAVSALACRGWRHAKAEINAQNEPKEPV